MGKERKAGSIVLLPELTVLLRVLLTVLVLALAMLVLVDCNMALFIFLLHRAHKGVRVVALMVNL